MRQSLGSTRRPISGGMVDRRNFLASAALGSISAPFARRQSPLEQDAPWQYDGAGTIARFGVVTPDFDPVPESELWAMASRGISVHGTRVPRPARPADFVGSPNIDNAVDRLVALAPRVILLAYTGSSYALGAKADEGVHERLDERAHGIPVIFTCGAATTALRQLRVRRLSLIHPPWFSEETNDRGRTYWREAGFEVLQCMRLQPLRSFSEVVPREVFEFVPAQPAREAEAVFIGGNGMRAVGAIQALETRLGRPVLTANQVLLWESLRRVDKA